MSKAIGHIREENGVKVQQDLEDHLCAVSALAEKFAGKVGLTLSGRLMGLLHDVGKYSKQFQDYIKSAEGLLNQDHDDYLNPKAAKGKIDHSTAGAQHIWRYYGRKPAAAPYAQILALGIASHHSGLIDCLHPAGKHGFGSRMDKDNAKTHYEECINGWDPTIEEKSRQLLTPSILRELHCCDMGIFKRAEKFLPPDVSSEDRLDNENSREVQRGLMARFLLSCLLDADRINSTEFVEATYRDLRARLPSRPWPRLIERLEEHLAAIDPIHPIDELRRDISSRCRERALDSQGLFTLTVPTGGGKTLASLRFALHHAQKYGLDRIIYVIPYTSIIDQNAKVAREILEKGEGSGTIVLEHHSNILPEMETWQNKLLADNWEAPIIFTTMVQFLESLFASGTRSARRMHNLARSVIIFDEIQSLPLRCIHLFCNALNFLLEICASSAMLCTATQPCLNDLPRPYRGRLALSRDREIMPNVTELFADLKRVDFFDHCKRHMTAEEIASLALEEMKRTHSCLVVCNTKGWADKIFRECNQRWSGSQYYLSTNLCPAHRLEKLEELRRGLASETARPMLCVSTQLIECGVDVSFGSVIRFAAGLDSILQAAGRCNRHGGARSGRVHIVTVENENLEFLQDIKIGREVYLRILHEYKKKLQKSQQNLNQPEIIAAYFRYYLHARKDIMAYAAKKHIRDDTLLNMLGINRYAPGVMPHQGMLKQSFMSASSLFQPIDSPTQAVLVPYKDGKNLIAEFSSTALFSKKRELLQTAQGYSVNLFPNIIQKLGNALHDIQQSGILALSEAYYSEVFGVMTEPHGTMSTYNY